MSPKVHQGRGDDVSVPSGGRRPFRVLAARSSRDARIFSAGLGIPDERTEECAGIARGEFLWLGDGKVLVIVGWNGRDVSDTQDGSTYSAACFNKKEVQKEYLNVSAIVKVPLCT